MYTCHFLSTKHSCLLLITFISAKYLKYNLALVKLFNGYPVTLSMVVLRNKKNYIWLPDFLHFQNQAFVENTNLNAFILL